MLNTADFGHVVVDVMVENHVSDKNWWDYVRDLGVGEDVARWRLPLGCE